MQPTRFSVTIKIKRDFIFAVPFLVKVWRDYTEFDVEGPLGSSEKQSGQATDSEGLAPLVAHRAERLNRFTSHVSPFTSEAPGQTSFVIIVPARSF